MGSVLPESGWNGPPTVPSRARLGIVLPSVNTVVEPWMNAVCPPGVTVHASRMLLGDKLTAEAIAGMDHEFGDLALREIATCRPSSVAYCCTASTLLQGKAYDDSLRARISEMTGTPATTATYAILAALASLGVTRVSVASPYTDEIDHAEVNFLRNCGIDVVSAANLGIHNAFDLASPEPVDIYALGRRAFDRRSEALLITCLNLRSHLVIEALERDLSVAVVTSTQAVLWKALRLSGVDDELPHLGALFRTGSP